MILKLPVIAKTAVPAVFMPFAVSCMHQPLKLDYLWAAMCIMGAVYFIFRS